jgi:GNAT superfamily N-acetyltransferase
VTAETAPTDTVPRDTATRVVVRGARPSDIHQLIHLIKDHAAYERADPPSPDLGDRLPAMIFGERARLHILVAETGDAVVGYASASLEASTWHAAEYLHLDCLYLAEGARGGGVGALMLDSVRALALELGASHVEWQTPEWNEGAIRFYDRSAAVRRSKQRYSLALSNISHND